ncbi:hypothetical protein EDB51_12357 [Vibrio crassostreae]|nr:hypothetical protein EDB51_12357 [Vibrio crassostreae]
MNSGKLHQIDAYEMLACSILIQKDPSKVKRQS